MLTVYDTLARAKRPFVPIDSTRVRMYVCGMTVYDYCHLGHARVLVVFDLIARWLVASGFDLTYVRNITDIDDKIIARAAANNESIFTLTERFIAAMNEDAARLQVLPPTAAPRATQHIDSMIRLIQQLIDRGLAYQAENGDVNYAVREFAGYGQLSGKSLDDLRAGERVAVNADKRDALDFVLWKQARADEPLEAQWDSPWGRGRPGWHIECSAMSHDLLGDHFDIHGGGQDLQFPHHENEIAQSQGAHGGAFVNYWLHNGFVRVDEEKMSKSLGNFFTIREVLKKFDAEVVRFFILRAHYRSPLNYSDAHLEDARAALTRLYTALNHAGAAAYHSADVDWAEPHAVRFKAALDDDFNTPEAFAELFHLANAVNRGETRLAAQLKGLAAIMGLLSRDPQEYLQAATGAGEGMTQAEIEALIAARAAAKKARDFATADRLRQQLLDAGILLEDGIAGTTWRRA